MGSVENLPTRLETFRKKAAGRAGTIDFPSGLSIITCRWSDEEKREALRERDFGSSPTEDKESLSCFGQTSQPAQPRETQLS